MRMQTFRISLNVHYRTLESDPVNTARRVIQHFGYPERPGFITGVNQWMADNPPNKHGKHDYRLEQFGLTRQRVDALFSDYARRSFDERR